MRALSITILAVAAVAPLYSFFASPAATQTWVKNYVATNTVASASSTNAVRRAEITMDGAMSTVMQILESDNSTNAVRRAANAAVNAAIPVVGEAMEGSVSW